MTGDDDLTTSSAPGEPEEPAPPESSAPPPPPPPLPPVPGEPEPPRIPWEDRGRVGFLKAFVETIGLFVTSPGIAFSRTRERGDYGSPILFAILVGWIGFLAEQVWSLAFKSSYFLFFPQRLREELGWVTERALGGSIVGFAIGFVLFPLLEVMGLFIGSAIFHLFLMLVDGLRRSRSGFEGTVRTLAYSSVATLGYVFPILGGLVVLIWGIALQTIGASTLHRTTKGRTLLAILIPVILCCTCAILFIGAIAALLAALFAGSRA